VLQLPLLFNFFGKEIYKMAAIATIQDNQLTFGGPGGHTYHQFTASELGEGKVISFYTQNNLIRAIQIGDNKYGGDGGSLYPDQGQLSSDRTFILKALYARHDSQHMVISGFEATIGDSDINISFKQTSAATCHLKLNLKVQFAGISFGSWIDSMVFQVIS